MHVTPPTTVKAKQRSIGQLVSVWSPVKACYSLMSLVRSAADNLTLLNMCILHSRLVFCTRYCTSFFEMVDESVVVIGLGLGFGLSIEISGPVCGLVIITDKSGLKKTR